MLKLIIGKAGTGKTGAVIGEISEAVRDKKAGNILLVPEQYSFEAERELLSAAGDSCCLYAEVLSFTGLARKLEDECGLGGLSPIDSAGKLMSMAVAAENVSASLQVYLNAGKSPQLQENLMHAIDEFKIAGVTPEALHAFSVSDESMQSPHENSLLSRKLSDLSLIFAAYESILSGGGRLDPADRMSILLSNIEKSEFGHGCNIFIDGFVDFTAVQMKIITALIKRAECITVCLTCDNLFDGAEVFDLSRRAARQLLSAAAEHGIKHEIKETASDANDPIAFLAGNLFNFSKTAFKYSDNEDERRAQRASVSLLLCENKNSECELAAAHAIALARSGCRWRDISVAIRGFDGYRSSLEAAFSYYGVPLFSARKADMSEKALPSLISLAYGIPENGWDRSDLFSYLRSGLCGIDDSDCDVLENYCLLWNIGAPAWNSPKPWQMHPRGYGYEYDEAANEELMKINALRHRAAEPLIRLHKASKAANSAKGQAEALFSYFDELALAEKLSVRADSLRREGRDAEAAEFGRLWNLVVSAVAQCVLIFKERQMKGDEFSRLLLLALSQYQVGSVPVSLDMVSAGDFDRMRRRHIRHLIVLGASDDKIPAGNEPSGILTEDERLFLTSAGLPLSAGDAELWRESTLIYNCLSLPSESVTIVCPAYDSEGSEARPSIIMTRASKLLDTEIRHVDSETSKLSAPRPAMELAADAMRGLRTQNRCAALSFFNQNEPQRLSTLADAMSFERGRLSPDSVKNLYGRNLRLSPSQVDKFYECRYKHFMSYGLRARPRRAAEFRQFEYGSFMHFIIENVTRDAKARGGFSEFSDEELRLACDKYIDEYARTMLHGLEGLSPRFVYLFRRLKKDVYSVVLDLAEELRHSSFSPINFELDITELAASRPIDIGDGDKLFISGKADRIDGWLHEGRLYLRVVDYKTGNVSFSLPDVLYGRYLQMLIYLFTLAEGGRDLYDTEVVPAGVLYIPARDVIVSAKHDIPDEKLQADRTQKLRRSGLLLQDDAVLNAMEWGDNPVRIPVKWKGGIPEGKALVSTENLGRLGRHIKATLCEAARLLRDGDIEAEPYFKSESENACLYCEFKDACRFVESAGQKRRYFKGVEGDKFWNALKGGEELE